MIKRVLLSRWVLGSTVDSRSLWQKLQLQDAKLWTQTQMKKEVFVSADISSSD